MLIFQQSANVFSQPLSASMHLNSSNKTKTKMCVVKLNVISVRFQFCINSISKSTESQHQQNMSNYCMN